VVARYQCGTSGCKGEVHGAGLCAPCLIKKLENKCKILQIKYDAVGGDEARGIIEKLRLHKKILKSIIKKAIKSLSKYRTIMHDTVNHDHVQRIEGLTYDLGKALKETGGSNGTSGS